MIKLDIDPRTRVVIFLSVIALALMIKDLSLIVILTTAVLLASIFSGKRSFIMKCLKNMIPLLIIAFLLWSFMHEWSLFQRYEDGLNLQFGAFMSLRLLLILLSSLWFIATMGMRDFINALHYFRLPYKMVFVFGLAMRHLYTIAEDYKAIKEAQSSRGLELDKGSLFKRIRNYVPILLPLFIRSIENAEKLSLAMELRAFSFNRRRYLRSRLKMIDLIVIASCTIAVILAILHYLLKVI